MLSAAGLGAFRRPRAGTRAAQLADSHVRQADGGLCLCPPLKVKATELMLADGERLAYYLRICRYTRHSQAKKRQAKAPLTVCICASASTMADEIDKPWRQEPECHASHKDQPSSPVSQPCIRKLPTSNDCIHRTEEGELPTQRRRPLLPAAAIPPQQRRRRRRNTASPLSETNWEDLSSAVRPAGMQLRSSRDPSLSDSPASFPEGSSHIQEPANATLPTVANGICVVSNRLHGFFE
ncbi:hypothetical protein Efla_002115 [Eimeria flavescens]